MAEGFLRAVAGDRFDVASAGTEAMFVHPLAIRVMDEIAIDPDPRELRTMYMDTHEAGLIKSADAGETWKPVRKALKNLAAMAVNPKRPREVCASATDGVIFKSTDGGTRWKQQ